jgi:hypothetical protein
MPSLTYDVLFNMPGIHFPHLLQEVFSDPQALSGASPGLPWELLHYCPDHLSHQCLPSPPNMNSLSRVQFYLLTILSPTALHKAEAVRADSTT